VSKRLGMNAETLRNWVRKQQVDDGQPDGVTSEAAAEMKALKRRNAELEETIEYSRRQRLSSCGRATRTTAADELGLRVHRREQRPLRGRSDLSRAHRARHPDRPAHVLRLGLTGALEAGLVGRRDHRSPGRLLRTRRARPPHTGVIVRVGEDVGPPAASVPGGQVHGGAANASNGWQGVRRQESMRTPISDPAAVRAPDLVERQFRVPTPNALVVADFTYVKLVTGVFVYVAFVIDAYAGAIIGWEAASVKQTRFAESAIRPAAALRARQGHRIDGAIHHSDAGSQYTAIHFGETLSLSGLRPSIGSVGDAYDNALAETTIGLYKNECIRADSPFRRGPLRNLADVELITADYVSWYNQQRLVHRLGRIPPAEAEAEYCDPLDAGPLASSQNPEGA
jgi:putative transposase